MIKLVTDSWYDWTSSCPVSVRCLQNDTNLSRSEDAPSDYIWIATIDIKRPTMRIRISVRIESCTWLMRIVGSCLENTRRGISNAFSNEQPFRYLGVYSVLVYIQYMNDFHWLLWRHHLFNLLWRITRTQNDWVTYTAVKKKRYIGRWTLKPSHI